MCSFTEWGVAFGNGTPSLEAGLKKADRRLPGDDLKHGDRPVASLRIWGRGCGAIHAEAWQGPLCRAFVP